MIYLSLFIISSVLSLQSAVIVTFSEAATATPSKLKAFNFAIPFLNDA